MEKTINVASYIARLYRFFCGTLFRGDDMPEIVINLSKGPSKRVMGWAAYNGWVDFDRMMSAAKTDGTMTKDDFRHELVITPYGFAGEFEDFAATLVHEMCHIWQFHNGNPSRNGYHNKQWANKMATVGLIASNTGKPGGAETGQQMHHYILKGGIFERVLKNVPEALKEFKFTPVGPVLDALEQENGERRTANGKLVRSKSTKKTKYSCPCGTNVWGKPDLHLACERCGESFQEQS